MHSFASEQLHKWNDDYYTLDMKIKYGIMQQTPNVLPHKGNIYIYIIYIISTGDIKLCILNVFTVIHSETRYF